MELPGKRELREQILHQMDGRTSYVSDKDVYREIDKAILRSSHGGYGTLSEKEELRRQMFYSIRGFDVLEKYLGDSSISEIMVIGASRIFVEQNGKIRRIEEHFSEEGDVYRLIEQIVAPTNRMVNEACPIVDSRLPDGSRVHIVLPPVSLEGPVITIRKFLKGGMTIEKLLAFEEFPEKLTGILSALVKSRYNILISGATNSGKSSLLNALAEYIGKRERVITIEDSAELQLFHVENLVRLETRNANMEGENEITIDMSVVKSETMRLADEAADVWKTDGKLADGTYKSQQLLLRNKNFLQKNRRGQLISKTRLRLQKRIATRLNIASLDSYKVSISGDKVLVQASVRLGNPLLGGRKYTGIKGWIFKCEEKADITNEEELLRKLSGNLR